MHPWRQLELHPLSTAQKFFFFTSLATYSIRVTEQYFSSLEHSLNGTRDTGTGESVMAVEWLLTVDSVEEGLNNLSLDVFGLSPLINEPLTSE